MILKLEPGGTAPFVQYQPLVINTARASGEESSKRDSSSSSSKNDGKITQKDLLTMLKDIDGLPSDMEELYGNMINFMRMGEAYGREIDTSMLATQFILSLRDIKTAVFRKDIFKKAYDLVEKNGGMHEVAITKDGKIIGRNKDGKLDAFSLEEFDSSEYTPVTNAELLRIRANDPNYAGNDYLSEIASNGIGLEYVNHLIHDYITQIGTKEVENTGVYKNPLLKAKNGLIYLQELAEKGIDVSKSIDEINEQIKNFSGATEKGLYKYTESDSDQIALAKFALSYIYDMLPINAKTLLKLKTGGEDNSKALISDMINARLSTKHSINLTPLKDGSSTSSSSEDTNDHGDLRTNLVLNILSGNGGDVSRYVMNEGTGAEMSVFGTNYRSIVDTSGKTIEDTDLASMLAESGLQGIVDKNSIYFGKQNLKSDRLGKVIYRNNGATRVLLPCVKEGNGKIRPRFEILNAYSKEVLDKVNKELPDNATFDDRMKATVKYIKQSSLADELLDASGNLNEKQLFPFLLVDTYVRENDIKIDENNNLVEQVSDDDIETYDYVEEVINKGIHKDSDKQEVDRPHWYEYGIPLLFRDVAEDIYKGTVFIPIVSNNKLGAVTASGRNLKYNTGIDIEGDYQRFLKLQELDTDIGWQN